MFGYAVYQGERVWITDVLDYRGKVEFCICWGSQPLWLTGDQLTNIQLYKRGVS